MENIPPEIAQLARRGLYVFVHTKRDRAGREVAPLWLAVRDPREAPPEFRLVLTPPAGSKENRAK